MLHYVCSMPIVYNVDVARVWLGLSQHLFCECSNSFKVNLCFLLHLFVDDVSLYGVLVKPTWVFQLIKAVLFLSCVF